MKPIILITLDFETHGSYSDLPYYALRTDYAKIVADLGALPLHVPYDQSSISEYIELADGFIIPGGDIDVDPIFYGETQASKDLNLNPTRSSFDFAFIKQALNSKKPMIAICAGMQVVNVMLGGTLYQDLNSDLPNSLEHKPLGQRKKPHHLINIKHDSLLASSCLLNSYHVNSSHTQAIKKLGSGLVATAHSEDGVIEAIELNDHPFFLGLEWHPEYGNVDGDRNIINAFIEATKCA